MIENSLYIYYEDLSLSYHFRINEIVEFVTARMAAFTSEHVVY